MKNTRTTNYIFTADPLSVTDMQQITIVKKTVKAMNDTAMQSYKYAYMRASVTGQQFPKKPTRQRVRLMGRGPRRIAERIDGLRRGSYDAYLPQRHAVTFDVYIADVR
ncbi:hypothetical protein [Lake Baikal phage Baikal-20-5m-C28]|nr:hypothetical protein [Lake Baikal phage Baikal-20-5m-C28]